LTPFVAPLPRPPAPPEVPAFLGPDCDAGGFIGPNTKFFRLAEKEALVSFVFHCHNIEHEDMRMMARMDIV
jgi:hypothetical protein